MGTQHFRSIERRIDLIVHGATESSEKFRAGARTLSVSGRGGMMALEPEVRIGQKLMLINVNSGQKAECKVVTAKPGSDGKKNVAFEFVSAEINFWKMYFPVAGTKPIRRTAQALFGPIPATKMAR
jgi:hypothetical protein